MCHTQCDADNGSHSQSLVRATIILLYIHLDTRTHPVKMALEVKDARKLVTCLSNQSKPPVAYGDWLLGLARPTFTHATAALCTLYCPRITAQLVNCPVHFLTSPSTSQLLIAFLNPQLIPQLLTSCQHNRRTYILLTPPPILQDVFHVHPSV